MNSCHLVLHGDTLAGQYFSAVLLVRNVSAISNQLYWRPAHRAGSLVFQNIFKKMNSLESWREAARGVEEALEFQTASARAFDQYLADPSLIGSIT